MEYLRRIDGTVIAQGESLRELIEANKHNLSHADLSHADLRYANLSYTDLFSANLSYADLRYANLSYADLRYTDLRYADLSHVNLSYADLRYANLSYADLFSADLRYANLSTANLSTANLSCANLRYVNLRYVNLSHVNLSCANLRGAMRLNYKLTSNPIQIHGLEYFVIIFDEHMEIGCEAHRFEDWEKFNNQKIIAMDGREAVKFWDANKELLLKFCDMKNSMIKKLKDNEG